MKHKVVIHVVKFSNLNVQVCYAGACYTEDQVVNSGQRRPRMPGVHDTSLFPGSLNEFC